MSQENVEITQRMIDAYNYGDVGTLADLATPDFEWLTSMGAIEGEIFRGRDGIEAYFANLSNAGEELRLYADEFRDLGERVVWLGRIRGLDAAAVHMSMRRWAWSRICVAARPRALGPSSTTARRCKRPACRSRR
jgi:ketosteroid isomerase-like protein